MQVIFIVSTLSFKALSFQLPSSHQKDFRAGLESAIGLLQ